MLNVLIIEVRRKRNRGRSKEVWRLAVTWPKLEKDVNMKKWERILNWVVTIAIAIYEAIQYVIQHLAV